MESLRGGVVILLDATDRAVAAELVALQRASYAVEAELIGSDQIPGLRESVEELVTAGLVWLGVLEGGRLAAALAYARLAGAADVDRLVVAPWAFRRGYGRALVTQLIELEPAGRFLVSTGSRNQPARRLYESLGFRVVGGREIAPGILVTRYELQRARG